MILLLGLGVGIKVRDEIRVGVWAHVRVSFGVRVRAGIRLSL